MMSLLIHNRLWCPRIPLIRCGGPQPLLNFPMGSLGLSPRRKDKVVFVLGATATGKSKLAIGLALHFGGEVVNSDKMQVYDGLDVITNKVTDEEMSGIPHHLLGGVHSDADFTASEYRYEAMRAIDFILRRGRVPIIAGGSNSYIEALVDGQGGEFRERYDCCFLWVDVELPELHKFVAERVDKMVEQGMVWEARGLFGPEADYTRGVRRSIGVPEMDRYLRAEAAGTTDEETKARLLAEAIDEIKVNTCKLTLSQLKKIHRLCTLPGWDVHRVDVTEVFLKKATPEAHETWVRVVMQPCIGIVQKFLQESGELKLREDENIAMENGVSAAAVTVKVLMDMDDITSNIETDVTGTAAATAAVNVGEASEGGAKKNSWPSYRRLSLSLHHEHDPGCRGSHGMSQSQTVRVGGVTVLHGVRPYRMRGECGGRGGSRKSIDRNPCAVVEGSFASARMLMIGGLGGGMECESFRPRARADFGG